jgi:hypothetical protein
MSEWQRYINSIQEVNSYRNRIASLGDDMHWTVGAGSKAAVKGSPLKTVDTKKMFKGKGINQISAPALEEEVEPETFEKHTQLEPQMWDEKVLKEKIADRLKQIAADFLKSLDVAVDLVDLRLTGSLANYTWSKYSDVDLHLVVDFSLMGEDLGLVKSYFDQARMRWNDNHDIMLYGYEVEIYVENINEDHQSSGIYSILSREWIEEPDPEMVPIDIPTARKKSDDIETRINLVGHMVDAKKYKSSLRAIEAIKHKIRTMRQAGLDSPAREFSAENIAFKILRRDHILEKLNALKKEAYDKLMSMSEG